MPTIKQLPSATSVNATDALPISQGGTTKALTVGELLSSTQTALVLAPGKLLGRVSTTAGGPESVNVGVGLLVDSGALSATGADHLTLPVATMLGALDEVVVNSGGVASRMAATVLRGLFSAGPGVTITGGTISASGSGGGSGSGYVLPVASTTTLGGVRVDGSSIVIDGNGVVSVQFSAAPMPTGTAIPANGGLLATSGTAGSAQAASTVQFEALMTAWLRSKPTAPAATPGWWNNSGNPTYS